MVVPASFLEDRVRYMMRPEPTGGANMTSAEKREPSMADHSAFQERELKLEFDVGDIGRLLHHPVIVGAQPIPQSSGILSATYFDTPDQALRRAGISLRIRKHHGRFIQTIKAETGPRGVAFDRAEWESEVDGHLDKAAARATPLQPILDDDATRVQIQPVFSVRTRRHAFLIERYDAKIELALDRAKVKAGRRSQRITEIELELKAGEPRSLFLVTKELGQAAPLRLSAMAKSEHGYRLAENVAPKPVKANPPEIKRGLPCFQAFQTIARETLSQIIQNEELVRTFGDPEALHQMRVGFRRLKTANSFFKKMLAGRETEAIKQELRRAAKVLGQARDLDVLYQNLKEGDASEQTDADLDDVTERRKAAYATVALDLDKPRFKTALLHAAIWVEAGNWLTRPSDDAIAARDRPVEILAAKSLAKRWKRIRRDAKRIADLPSEKRHALRVRIKALRYGAEFFASVFKGRGTAQRRKSLLSSFEHLQDVLGEMNDIAVRQNVLPALIDRQPDDTAARMETLLGHAKSAARTLRSTKPFWE